MKLGSGAFQGAYSFSSRFEEGTGTNPEELIGIQLLLEFAQTPTEHVRFGAHVNLQVVSDSLHTVNLQDVNEEQATFGFYGHAREPFALRRDMLDQVEQALGKSS